METFKWIWGYLKDYKFKYGFCLVLVLVAALISMINPILGGIIVDRVLEGGETNILIPILLITVVTALVKNIVAYTYQMSFERISQNILIRIRKDLFDKLLTLDVDFYKQMKTGDLMARITGDTDLLRHFIAWVIYNILNNVSVFVFGLLCMWFINPTLTIAMLIVCPFIAFFTEKMSRRIGPTFHKAREAYSRLNSVVQENISGNRIVKAFSKEDYEIEKFNRQNAFYKEANMDTIEVTQHYIPILEFLASFLTVVMIFIGGILVIQDQMTIGDLMAFNGLLWALNNPMRSAGYLINDTQRFIASSKKIRELLATESKIQNQEDAQEPERIKGEIEFKNVSFSFEDTDALRKVSFKAKPGQTIGIIGHTGAGKSTLINLICRFYEPVSGQVLIDGKDIRSYSLKKLRESIAMAMQEVFLFSDTIEANIRYGVPRASSNQIQQFAAMAEADSFIRSMPEGYDTVVGERGVGLSGGQRQRIALARALIKDPSVLILDDTTSALDMETEMRIQQKLNETTRKRTTFIIAHRISSVKAADLILVLRRGRVIEQGTHDELMALKGHYYKVFETQFGDFDQELADFTQKEAN
ncbi:ABC transporter ATP-binding protein [Niameybacter massiliensis]|uniref:ABC transporter ATP-binding protein n=1 Tax=Holtiella tumoricola TaxID=3018743 RepID=A0AA42DQF1_9FIRM|nr:ABC transporter ATP-binding protein [Holtiella tumoricola]MDA3733255.1 ABC transporter ATP-binding protein [Holtiella tumoricola]